MKLPSKVTPYRNSTLARFPDVLKKLELWGELPVSVLFQQVKSKSFGVNNFIEVLDYLFWLEKIEFVPGGEVLRYVKGNKL